jgi:hypothetical protein
MKMMVIIIVNKPEPAWWVYPIAGLVRVRQKTGMSKNLTKLDRPTRLTCDPGDPAKPG